MRLFSISAGHFHCDGGALFGVIPKVLWSKKYSANEDNFTQLTLRCLLVDAGTRRVLIETGVGNHYPKKYLQNNGVTSVTKLEESLQKAGYLPEDITDVLFTHLHWDHCTGAVKNENDTFKLAFPNADLWCSKLQWEHAKVSNPRERAAYHRPLLDFMYDSGKLKLIENEGNWLPEIDLRFFDGHTPGQLIPLIRYQEKTFVYTSDLIPTTANIPLLWIASYDLDAVKVMEEKQEILTEIAEQNYYLFFEHDYYTECASVKNTPKGFVLNETFELKDLL